MAKCSSLTTRFIALCLASLMLGSSACARKTDSMTNATTGVATSTYSEPVKVSDVTNKTWYCISLWKPQYEDDLFDIGMVRFLDDGTCKFGWIGYNPSRDTPESFEEKVEENMDYLLHTTTTWEKVSDNVIIADYTYLNEEDRPISFTVERNGNLITLRSLFDTGNKRYATYYPSLLQTIDSYQ